MASFYFLIFFFCDLLYCFFLLLVRLVSLIDQAWNFDFANLLDNIKNASGPLWHDVVLMADLRHSKLKATIAIMTSALGIVLPWIILLLLLLFFALKLEVRKNLTKMSAAFLQALTFPFFK